MHNRFYELNREGREAFKGEFDNKSMTYVSDIEKLKEFMVGNNNAEEVKALNDDPINLLIKAAYGLTDCEKLRRNKLAFNEKFLHLYAYLIVAVHRAMFEGGNASRNYWRS